MCRAQPRGEGCEVAKDWEDRMGPRMREDYDNRLDVCRHELKMRLYELAELGPASEEEMEESFQGHTDLLLMELTLKQNGEQLPEFAGLLQARLMASTGGWTCLRVRVSSMLHIWPIARLTLL